jgi:LysR family transcriptional regulator, regulator for genes of the gallate degradation pathway
LPSRDSSSTRELLNLAHLHVFLRVARHGSATKAADALYRAQSAVTRAVHELEQALGTPLFERRPSGMLPTATGRTVIERVERVFGELEQLAAWCASRQPRTRLAAPTGVPSSLLNTRRLQLLVELARHRHMPSAAHALGISQPAVSSAVKILETSAGFPLFYRNARGLQLTSDGETFVLHVRRALNQLRHVPDDVAALQGSIQGHVAVGALPLGRALILPEAVARVTRSFPGVQIATDESAYDQLAAGLRAGDIDFILGALRPIDPASGLVTERLLTEQMVVLARPDHPLARVRGLSLKQLADVRWVLPRSHTPSRAILDTLFERMKLAPPVAAVETADLAMIRGLLLRTDMVAALSAQQLRYECAQGQLTMLDVPMPDTERDIGLTMRALGEPSPAARKLIDAIRAVVAETSPVPAITPPTLTTRRHTLR